MKLKDIKEKLKKGFRFYQLSASKWGAYNFEVLRVVERGVVAQLYHKKWVAPCMGHEHLIEWSAKIQEI